MKTLTTLLLLLITISLSAKPKPLCIGYWIVTYDTEQGYKKIPTVNLVDVYTVANLYFPDNCIDFGKELKKSVYFEIEIDGKSVYIEVKKITFDGKFKKLNKREIKEYLK